MKKRNILSENIFTTLAKMIAAFQIQKKVGTVIKKIPDDPEVKQALEDIQVSTDKSIKILKDYCKRNPDNPKCKEKYSGK